MKSLDDWLASSDEESTKAAPQNRRPSNKGLAPRRQSRTPSPHQTSLMPLESESPTMATSSRPRNQTTAGTSTRAAEAEERRRRQEEMRQKMKATLGDQVVDRIVTAAAPPPLRKSDDYANDSFTSSGTGSMLPPRGGGGGGKNADAAGKMMMSSRRASVLQSGSFLPENMEEVEVLLADRGTQTVDHASCQTDPAPDVLQCPGCYHDYYGHMPSEVRCPHGVIGRGGGGGGSSGDPIFDLLRFGSGNNNKGVQCLPSSSHQRGAIGMLPRPYSEGGIDNYNGGGNSNSHNNMFASMGTLRDQLTFVQSSLDALISRYNLPPPPGLEHLAVGR